MTAKEYLNQAFYLKKEIKALQFKVEQVRSDAVYRKNTIGYERGCTAGDKLSNFVAKLDILERQINRRIGKLACLERDILVAINKIDNSLYRQVLINRYLNGFAWGRIAQIMGYEQTNLRTRLHGRALQAFSKFIK